MNKLTGEFMELYDQLSPQEQEEIVAFAEAIINGTADTDPRFEEFRQWEKRETLHKTQTN